MAFNGKEGLKIFEQSKPGSNDAILMDMSMPVMDGLAAAKKICTLNRTDAASVPIIAMTANAFEEDVQQLKSEKNTHPARTVEAEKSYHNHVR